MRLSASAAILFAVMAVCASTGQLSASPAGTLPAPEIQTLILNKDPSTGDVMLEWSDGVPSFAVRRNERPDFNQPAGFVYITRSTLAAEVRDPVLYDGTTYFYLVDDANVQARLCPDAVPPATDGICDLSPTGGSGPGLLLRGNVLDSDGVLLAGSILIDGEGVITCLGCDCSGVAGFAEARHVECAEGVISPGLVNPHDHIRYSENPPIAPSMIRYDHRHEWRTGMNGAQELDTPTNPSGTGATSAGTRWVEIRQAMGGVTSMAGAGRADGMVRNLDDPGDPQEGLGIPGAELATFPLGDSNAVFRPDCTWNYTDAEAEVAGFSAYVPHIAEGINTYAAEEFFCQSRSSDGGHDFTESNVAHVHGIGLTASDYLRMAHDSAPLIWSPRSNIRLYGMTAQVTTFRNLGGNIALGSDWSYSGSIHSVRELACADLLNRSYYGGSFADRDLWEMATTNAAHTLGAESLIGSIEVGKLADLVVFDDSDGQHYRAIIDAGATDVALALRGGTSLYGEVDVLAGLGEHCEAIDVCGDLRSLCAAREFGGTSYSDLEAIVSAAGGYPAFFCSTPTNEPTCVPLRLGEYTGQINDLDSDGDGIENDIDNCPRVFNPARPLIDGLGQADSDGDGFGDACDAVPLDPDLDSDTVPNHVDNCPWDANTLQIDDDGDGKGNACDPCPDIANPDTACPPPQPMEATIAEIQTGVIPEGTIVTVSNVVVTGIGSPSFHIQDPTAVADTRFSGLTVYVGGAPTVAVNDLVDVTGEIVEYFGDTELSNVTDVTIVGSSTPIASTPLTVAEAATEEYEGVLVTLTDGVVTDLDYDCSVTPPCSDSGLWEIGGPTGVVAYDRYYEDLDWDDHIGQLPITGVMMYRFDRRRIMPRTMADFPDGRYP